MKIQFVAVLENGGDKILLVQISLQSQKRMVLHVNIFFMTCIFQFTGIGEFIWDTLYLLLLIFINSFRKSIASLPEGKLSQITL